MPDTPPPRRYNPPPWIGDDPERLRKFWAAAAKEEADWAAAEARRNRGIRGLIRRTRTRNTQKAEARKLQGFHFGPSDGPVRSTDAEPPNQADLESSPRALDGEPATRREDPAREATNPSAGEYPPTAADWLATGADIDAYENERDSSTPTAGPPAPTLQQLWDVMPPDMPRPTPDERLDRGDEQATLEHMRAALSRAADTAESSTQPEVDSRDSAGITDAEGRDRAEEDPTPDRSPRQRGTSTGRDARTREDLAATLRRAHQATRHTLADRQATTRTDTPPERDTGEREL